MKKKVYDELDPIVDAVGVPEAFLMLWEEIKPKLIGNVHITGTGGELKPDHDFSKLWANQKEGVHLTYPLPQTEDHPILIPSENLGYKKGKTEIVGIRIVNKDGSTEDFIPEKDKGE
jgi:hypothetical protein